jgi:hypothetical protein
MHLIWNGKWKRAAATALLSGASQIEFAFDLWKVHRNFPDAYWIVFTRLNFKNAYISPGSLALTRVILEKQIP